MSKHSRHAYSKLQHDIGYKAVMAGEKAWLWDTKGGTCHEVVVATVGMYSISTSEAAQNTDRSQSTTATVLIHCENPCGSCLLCGVTLQQGRDSRGWGE